MTISSRMFPKQPKKRVGMTGYLRYVDKFLKEKPKKKLGVRVRHTNYKPSPGVTIHLVPCMWLPFPNLVVGKDECPTCGIIHPVKTVHLHLDASGACLVSEGVLELLRKAGLERNELQVVDHTDSPPPLKLNGHVTRPQVDQSNARISKYK